MGDVEKIHSAIRWGKPIAEIKEAGLTTKENADAKDPKNGNSCIQLAVQNGHADITRFLVDDLKCDVNAKNAKGNTALHMGVEYDYYSLNRILVDGGADPDVMNDDGFKALTGLGGTKIDAEAWDHPLTMLKNPPDTQEALEEIFSKFEELVKDADAAKAVNKADLVQTGMKQKKALTAWAAGGFQGRFMKVVQALP